jgi:EAL domain-containing protein (putative c-di-GMP-specific phosphodiesterase class I)
VSVARPSTDDGGSDAQLVELVELARGLAGATTGYLLRLTAGVPVAVAVAGERRPDTHLAYAAMVMAEGAALVVPATGVEPPEVAVASWAGVPLADRRGRVIGLLVVCGTTPLPRLAESLAPLEALAQTVVARWEHPGSSDTADPSEEPRAPQRDVAALPGRRPPAAPTDERAIVERLLRIALRERELVVHYQPVVDLGSRITVGVEALVRLRLPDGRLLLPDRFLSVAEDCDLIGVLGGQVRRTAMTTVATWRRELPTGRELTLSVNLSARELSQPDLLKQVAEELADTGLDPAALNLELAETAFLTPASGHEELLVALHDLGVRIHLDDFGTGVSPLGYLRRLPVDGLKLGRSFVGDLDLGTRPRAVTGALVRLAGQLGVRLIAEGVETEQQASMLGEDGCLLGQGFLFARPGPANRVRRMALSAAAPAASRPARGQPRLTAGPRR